MARFNQPLFVCTSVICMYFVHVLESCCNDMTLCRSTSDFSLKHIACTILFGKYTGIILDNKVILVVTKTMFFIYL